MIRSMPVKMDKVRLLENVARLRRAERQLPENRDIPAVRASLEVDLGATVSQRVAAQLLGVSHTALARWVKRGDLPTVFGRNGRPEVPVPALLDLYEQVSGQRQLGRGHPIEPGMVEAHRRASRITPSAVPDDVDSHRLAELRSLAYHEAVARRLRRAMVDDARHQLWIWSDQGRIDPYYADLWEHLLQRPIREIKDVLTEDTQRGRDLRQNSPFAGMLSEVERRTATGR